MKSIFVLGLLATFALSGGHPVDEIDVRISLDELTTQAKDIISKLESFITGDLLKDINSLNDFKGKFEDLKNEFMGKGTSEISAKINEVVETVKNLKKNAANAGVIIDECTNGVDTKLKDLGNKLIGDLRSCIDVKLDEANKIIDNALSACKEITNDISTLPGNLLGCFVPPWTAFGCIEKLVSTASSMTAKIPAQMSKIIDETSAFFDTLPAHLTTCATNQALAAGAQAGVIGIDCAKCVGDKILGKASTYDMFLL